MCPRLDTVGVLVDSPHDLLPALVDLSEHLGLVGQLPLDVRGSEYALQVQPVALALQPFILLNCSERERDSIQCFSIATNR